VTDAAWGPIFGRDEKHLVTLGRKGMISNQAMPVKHGKRLSGFPPRLRYQQARLVTNIAYDPSPTPFTSRRWASPRLSTSRR